MVVSATIRSGMRSVMRSAWKSITRPSSPAHRSRERKPPGAVRVVVHREIAFEAERQRVEERPAHVGRPCVRGADPEIGRLMEGTFVAGAVVVGSVLWENGAGESP